MVLKAPLRLHLLMPLTALGPTLCLDLSGTNCRGHLGQAMSIWTALTSAEQGGSTMHCSELFRAKRETVTEVTAEPQATRTMRLAPWQAWFGTICPSSREQESLFCAAFGRNSFPGTTSYT